MESTTKDAKDICELCDFDYINLQSNSFFSVVVSFTLIPSVEGFGFRKGFRRQTDVCLVNLRHFFGLWTHPLS